MNNTARFVCWTAGISLVLYLFATLTGSGPDDLKLLDALHTGLILAGLLIVWRGQKQLEKKLEALMEEKKKDEYDK